jgi:hypothetical protein
VNESRNNVPILNGKVVMWSIDIGWNDGCKVAPVLFSVGTVHGVDKTLCISISFIRRVGRAIVEHSFINWIGRFVRENTSGEHRNEFFHLGNAAKFHNVVIDQGILSVKFNLSPVNE